MLNHEISQKQAANLKIKAEVFKNDGTMRFIHS
jgi:hypothetical protein